MLQQFVHYLVLRPARHVLWTQVVTCGHTIHNRSQLCQTAAELLDETGQGRSPLFSLQVLVSADEVERQLKTALTDLKEWTQRAEAAASGGTGDDVLHAAKCRRSSQVSDAPCTRQIMRSMLCAQCTVLACLALCIDMAFAANCGTYHTPTHWHEAGHEPSQSHCRTQWTSCKSGWLNMSPQRTFCSVPNWSCSGK